MMMSKVVIDLLLGIGITLATSLIFRQVITRITKRTKTDFDDFVLRTLSQSIIPLGIVLTLYLIKEDLSLNNDIQEAYEIALRVILTLVFVRFSIRVSARFVQGLARRTGDEELTHLAEALTPLIQAAIWAIGFLILLQSMGVSMGVIWGLLSAGGIGIGLALKEPAQELFAYLMILLDKPFTVGQFINIGSVWASIEHIGVRSTRLRNLRGEIIVMNNSTLISGTIYNFADMSQRRMIYKIGVAYKTSVDLMQEIPTLIENIVNAVEHTDFNRCHFTEFADSSLNFELVYYIDTRDYTIALNAQQEINLNILKAFAERGVEIAFPTQTIYLEGDAVVGKPS
jgi:small-conductance mechanosensitive channel